MKIGIIVYSHTGNTLSVAERIREKLTAKGHETELKRVIPAVDDPKVKAPMEFASAPDATDYDVLLFGSPVWGFSLSTVMKDYLTKQPSLSGKPVGCFLTHAFPYPWLGGNSAMKQFRGLCEKKGAKVAATAIVNWSSKKREKDIITGSELLGKIGG